MNEMINWGIAEPVSLKVSRCQVAMPWWMNFRTRRLLQEVRCKDGFYLPSIQGMIQNDNGNVTKLIGPLK